MCKFLGRLHRILPLLQDDFTVFVRVLDKHVEDHSANLVIALALAQIQCLNFT